MIFGNRRAREHQAAALEWIRPLRSARTRPQMLHLLEAALSQLGDCPESALFEIAGEPATVALAAYFGDRAEALIPVAETIVRAATRKSLFVLFPARDVVDDDSTVCLPLRADGHLIGALVLFGFLEHKAELRDADAQLLAVLSTQVASALLATRAPAAAAANG